MSNFLSNGIVSDDDVRALANTPGVTFKGIEAVYKTALGGSGLGFDPNRAITVPKKENFIRRMLNDSRINDGAAQTAWSALCKQVHEANGTETQSTSTQETEKMTPQNNAPRKGNISPEALAGLANVLGAALGGFDADEVRQTVKDECDKAMAVVKTTIDRAVDSAKNAAIEASAVRTDVNKAKSVVEELLANIGNVAELKVSEAIANSLPRQVEVKTRDGKVNNVGIQHKTFPVLIQALATGEDIWLPGPAGSGKTSAAKFAAKALGLPFHPFGRVISEHQLLGYKDAMGNYHTTPFREAYEHGGVFLGDEMDAWSNEATLILNMALDNGILSFPDKTVTRHDDFRAIAAANTFGSGATAQYVGRNKMDAAFLDRWVFLIWGYDDQMEITLSGNAPWAKKVQAWRKRAESKGMKVLISPRASYKGAKLLAAGFAESDVIQMVVRKGIPDDQWAAIA